MAMNAKRICSSLIDAFLFKCPEAICFYFLPEEKDHITLHLLLQDGADRILTRFEDDQFTVGQDGFLHFRDC